MSNLNKFGITEAQMLVLANQHAIQYRFANDDMRDLLAYSQALLALAAPASPAAPSGELPPLPKLPTHATLYTQNGYRRASVSYRNGGIKLVTHDAAIEAMQAYARAAIDATAPNKQLVEALKEACDLIRLEVADGVHTEEYRRGVTALASAGVEVAK